ncbi:uncharacterized protein [Bemisia tabaci]|uniref:uncharacterized protein isoform X2 n=1 Tax=Bemisia tabaci TaxID=7038 RepID=UPI003B287A59
MDILRFHLRSKGGKLRFFFLLCQFITDAAGMGMNVNVTFRAPRYVLFGDRAPLYCEYDVAIEALHKVEWLKNNKKIFQFVRGRNPPFKIYPHNLDNGATLDGPACAVVQHWQPCVYTPDTPPLTTQQAEPCDIKLKDAENDERHVTLKNVNFSASGLYSCAVSLESPIFTKASNEAELTVMQSQTEGPYITMPKPEYSVGDQLDMNCTSSPAVPDPEITWILNGKQVERSFIRTFPVDNRGLGAGLNGGMSGAVKLALPLTEAHVPKIMLTCLSTIPAYLGPGASRLDYADYRANSVSIAVKPAAEPITSSAVADEGATVVPEFSSLFLIPVVWRLSLLLQSYSL